MLLPKRATSAIAGNLTSPANIHDVLNVFILSSSTPALKKLFFIWVSKSKETEHQVEYKHKIY